MSQRSAQARPPGRRPRRTLLALAAAAVAIVALAACGGERDTGTDSASDAAAGPWHGGRLSIATGNTTGVYYQLGGGYADLITKHLPQYQATAEATGASAENIQRIARGDADIAFTLADTANDAATGAGAFDRPQPIRALARIYTNYTQVVATKGSGIGAVADMRGKRVSTGSPNSGTEVIALRLLTAAGLDPDKDIQRQSLSLPEAVQGMKDGTLDGSFWSGGLPPGGLTDLTTSRKGDAVFPPARRPAPETPSRARRRLRRGNRQQGRLPTAQRRADHRRAQPARRQRPDARPARPRPDQAPLRPPARPRQGPSGGQQHHPRQRDSHRRRPAPPRSETVLRHHLT
jgi:uncharacterized protein